jgi:small redox-active disulfide protein 2
MVIGVGCAKCNKLAENAEQALGEVGRGDVEVQRVHDMDQIADLGVVLPPALVVDNVVWSSGKVMSAESIAEKLRKVLASPNQDA